MADRQALEAELRKRLSEVSALDIHIVVVKRELHDLERTLSDNEAVTEEFRRLTREAISGNLVDLLEYTGLRLTLTGLKADIIRNRNDLVEKRSELLRSERRIEELRDVMSKIEAELSAVGSIVSWATKK